MSSLIKSPRDFWSGAIFVVIGLAALYIGQDYAMGSAGRMGPAYFPNILGGLLAITGATAVARSLVTKGESVGQFTIKGAVLVITGPILFGLLIRGAGLMLSVLVLVMLSGMASIKFRTAPFLAVAIGLAIFCVLVFVKALGLPMPVVGPWLSL